MLGPLHSPLEPKLYKLLRWSLSGVGDPKEAKGRDDEQKRQLQGCWAYLTNPCNNLDASIYLRFKTFKNYVYAEVYVGGMCCTLTHTHAHESDIAHAHTEVR